ncbi:hypothetical protein [Pontibacter liquoris]|uniref:hypothetical protein n=1 Tax=Pontibacter liquoris TaxID=2905677 RepID=UPI001FA6E959|nr:hypothetical protein [Pontibacter liquoris]
MKSLFSTTILAVAVFSGSLSLYSEPITPATFASSFSRLFLATDLPQDTTKRKTNHVVINTGESGKGNFVYINSDDNRQEKLTYKGNITLTDDFQDIKSISPKGYLEYVTTVNDQTKRLEIKSDAQGKLTRSYFENGKAVSYEPAGRQWLQQVMPGLMATTGIGLEARVKAIYQKQGTKGVLAEAEKVENGSGKLRMLNYLLEQPGLKPADMRLALQRAGSFTDSDYELGKLLGKVPASFLKDGSVTTAYLQAAGSLGSDYEKGKALAYLLQQPTLHKEATDNVLAAIGSMSSDYEKSKLLQQWVNDGHFNPDKYKSTFAVIDHFASDYEKGKSLQSLLNKYNFTPAQYQELLPVVSRISSDYEKGKLLRTIAAKIPANATALRDDYKKTARTISSDYEYRKVIDALD